MKTQVHKNALPFLLLTSKPSPSFPWTGACTWLTASTHLLLFTMINVPDTIRRFQVNR